MFEVIESPCGYEKSHARMHILIKIKIKNHVSCNFKFKIIITHTQFTDEGD